MTPDARLPALIVGGGVAGLSLAAALRRAGRPCEIVERAASWAPVGAGIGLAVNAMKVLRALGLADEVVARGHRIREAAITDDRGRVLSNTRLGDLERRFGPTVAIHRADLHEALLGAVGDVPLRQGETVESIVPSGDGVDVVLTNGHAGRYGLVVGADGLRSRVRELAFGGVAPTYAGYTTWRLVVSRPDGPDRMVEMWGRGRRFGVVPIDAERVYAYAAATSQQGCADPDSERVARFKQRFADFRGPAPAVLERLEAPDTLIQADIFEVVTRRWVDGRVALVGDAAHAMTPDLGQGAAMALEDSHVLAEELAESEDVPSALVAWEARRRRRVRSVQRQSGRIGRALQWENPLATRARDGLVRLSPDSAATRILVRLAGDL